MYYLGILSATTMFSLQCPFPLSKSRLLQWLIFFFSNPIRLVLCLYKHPYHNQFLKQCRYRCPTKLLHQTTNRPDPSSTIAVSHPIRTFIYTPLTAENHLPERASHHGRNSPCANPHGPNPRPSSPHRHPILHPVQMEPPSRLRLSNRLLLSRTERCTYMLT